MQIHVVYDQWVDFEGYPQGTIVFHSAFTEMAEAQAYRHARELEIPEWSNRRFYIANMQLVDTGG